MSTYKLLSLSLIAISLLQMDNAQGAQSKKAAKISKSSKPTLKEISSVGVSATDINAKTQKAGGNSGGKLVAAALTQNSFTQQNFNKQMMPIRFEGNYKYTPYKCGNCNQWHETKELVYREEDFCGYREYNPSVSLNSIGGI